MSKSTAAGNVKQRAKVLLLAVIFIGPLAVAAFLYFGPNQWRPSGQTNNGTLIQPVITLPEVALGTPFGEPTRADFLRGKWSLTYLDRQNCDDDCRTVLIKIRQIRLAIGSESDRVQRLYMTSGSVPEQQWFNERHAGLIVVNPDSVAVFAGALTVLETGLYIIDPLGNVMMHYPTDTEPKPIYEDLKKLLKVSRIG